MALHENITPLWAEEILRNKGADLGNRAIYELILAATGDQQKAEDAQTRRIEEELRSGKTPTV